MKKQEIVFSRRSGRAILPTSCFLAERFVKRHSTCQIQAQEEVLTMKFDYYPNDLVGVPSHSSYSLESLYSEFQLRRLSGTATDHMAVKVPTITLIR